MKCQYLQLVITFLTASVYGAPTVFVVQPLVLPYEPLLGTLQRGAGLVVNFNGQHTFLVPLRSSLESQGKKVTEEQYDDSYKESQARKEQHDTDGERQQELEENGDYENGYHTVGKKYKGNENYSQISYEETTTENRGLEETDAHVQETEDASKSHENPQEDRNNRGSSEEEDGKEISTEGSFNETTESPNEPGSTDDKSTNSQGNTKSR